MPRRGGGGETNVAKTKPNQTKRSTDSMLCINSINNKEDNVGEGRRESGGVNEHKLVVVHARIIGRSAVLSAVCDTDEDKDAIIFTCVTHTPRLQVRFCVPIYVKKAVQIKRRGRDCVLKHCVGTLIHQPRLCIYTVTAS